MSMKSKLESAYAKALTGTFKVISPIKRTIKKTKCEVHLYIQENALEILNYNGYIVVGMDTRGHGRTAVEGLGLGIVTDGDSFADTVADQIDLAKHIKEKYNLPLCLFGHSFGSFLSQSFIQRASDLLEGVILCGSAKQKGLDIKTGEIVSKLQKVFCGKDKPAKFITKMAFGGFDKKFAYDKMENAWVCSNLDSVKKYNEDEWCGAVASIGFFKSLFCGVKDLYEECNLDCIRKELKILIISGDKDPVGGYGKKVEKLFVLENRLLSLRNVIIGSFSFRNSRRFLGCVSARRRLVGQSGLRCVGAVGFGRAVVCRIRAVGRFGRRVLLVLRKVFGHICT